MKCKTLLFIITCNILIGCKFNNNEIREKIECLREHRINIPLSSMKIIKRQEQNVDNMYKMISYWDSKSCTKCEISHLYLWSNIIKKSNNVSFYFIFEVDPSSTNLFDSLPESICNNSNVTICIDSTGMFRNKNPMFPQESFLQTLLVDESNQIILVGNPLKNLKIKELYFERIKL